MKLTTNQIIDYKNITLFPGLNSLRFMAAFFVLMQHGERIKAKNGIENFEWLGLFQNGGHAVTFFFVLSGFLITYLLLKERHTTGNIQVKKFYLKRILRIWPLYFLLVFIGTIALPLIFPLLNVQYEMPYTLGQSWYYFVFFLPGLVTFFYGHHFLEPLWSIGSEEVFYLIWAPIFKLFKNKLFSLLIGIIALKVALSALGLFVIPNALFNYLLGIFKFEAMAVGGLGAYLIYTKGSTLNKLTIFKIPYQLIIFSILCVFLLFHSNIDNTYWNLAFKTPIISPLLIDCLFLYLILCVSMIDHSIIKLRHKFFSFLGEISYGIYMYHMLVIFATIHFLKDYFLHLNIWPNVFLFYLITGSFTILIASLSKIYFENYFLNLKKKLENK